MTLVSLSGWFQPARAISIKEEEELAREFLKVVAQHFELIDDPFIVSYVRAVGKKISRHTHDLPFTFHFYVIKEDVYNAFAIPAGHIFINSGLLAAMESEDELAGILSHEMAHAACRHISQQIDRSKKIDLASMAGMVAGIFLGAATGDATALQALTIGSAAAGQAATLAYSRTDETQADQVGLIYLQNAGYSGRGLVSALKRIRLKTMVRHPAGPQLHDDPSGRGGTYCPARYRHRGSKRTRRHISGGDAPGVGVVQQSRYPAESAV